MELLEILLLFLLMFSVVHSKNHCPNFSCGNNTFQIRYPFKLEGQQPQNCDYIDVKCNGAQSVAVLGLPSSGDFNIHYIDYDSSTVELYDPNNCLPGRLMNLTLQDSPFMARDYQSFTFYDCPSEAVRSNFTAIECLSNYTNAVVATSSVPIQVMEESYGCSVISTSPVPLSWFDSYDFGRNNNSNNLVLKWYVSDCKDCRRKDGWWLKVLSRFFAIILMIPAIAVLLVVLFFCIGCCIHTVDNYTRERENARANRTIIARIRTLSTTFSTATSPPTGNATGLDDARIQSCSELVVVDPNENGSDIPGLTEKYSCSICLEEYDAREKVRRINLCQHWFHADCIYQWLQKNSTCPICRVSLSDVKL